MGNMKGGLLSSMAMLTMMVLMKVGVAVDYTVGGQNGGWDQSTNLTSWSSQLTFQPGDNLVFQYTPNHNVIEVSAADFDSCTTTNPLRPPFSGGRSVVALTSTGSRYFTCATSGHCISGMKLKVNVVLADAPTPPTNQSPPTATTPPTNQSPPATPTSPSPPKFNKPVPLPKKNKAAASSPALPPAAEPTPGGSLSPPPAPSSGSKFNGMGGTLAAAAIGFLIMVV